MKKLILCGTAILLSLCFGTVQAQTAGWNANGGWDNFDVDYSSELKWSSDSTGGFPWFSISRATAGTLALQSKNGASNGAVGGYQASTYAYPTFRVTFDTMDLSNGADIEINVNNTASTILVLKIELLDATGKKSDIEPNVSDVLNTYNWGSTTPAGKYPRKANNGFIIAGNSIGTFRIDLSSVPANMGGLTRTGWVNENGCNVDGPYCGPATAHQIDPSQIVGVIFSVNHNDGRYIFSQGAVNNGVVQGDYTDDYIIQDSGPDQRASVVPYNGVLKIEDFKIGNFGVTEVTKSLVENSLKVYPNPTKDVLNVSFEANGAANVALTDMLGNTVYFSTSVAGQNNLTVNTSSLNSGLYILNIATENGKVSRKVTVR